MKTVIITGGNTGLGLQCARAIVRGGGWRVVLACRDRGRGERAADDLRALAASSGARDTAIEVGALDLGSLASVRAFAATVAAGGALAAPAIDALVCNAGLQFVRGRQDTVDGFESTFAVNHLGHFLLANLLVPALARGGRIVFVASGTHDPDQWTGMPKPRMRAAATLANPPAPDEAAAVAGRRAYTTSKLCNVLCAYELARRLPAERAITVTAFDPGMMPGSGLARDYPAWQRVFWSYVMPALIPFSRNVNTVRGSGRALAALAIDPKYDGVTGRYFVGTRETKSSRESYDEAIARALWDDSAALVKLAARETLPELARPAA